MYVTINTINNVKFSVKSLKEGRNCGFDPALRKLSIKNPLAHCVLRPTLRVG
jgi:hypothetical protein